MDKIRATLINDILKLDRTIWIPVHQTTEDELEVKNIMELTMYYNSLCHVRDNPV
jgi:hypothetical protein